MKLSGKKLGIVQMIICASLWSIAGILMKLLPWSGLAVASLRSLISGLTIAVYMMIAHKRFVLTKQTLVGGVITGLVYLCFACANKLTTAANAIVLQFTSPIFIVVFSVLFFKAKLRKRDLITVIVTLFGIALFFFDELETGYIFGNCVAILAGIMMAAMYLAVGNQEGDTRFSTVLIGQTVTFLIGLPFVFTTKPVINVTTVSVILILGIFQLGIAYILYVKASVNCPPLACSLLGGIEPLLNPVWVFIFDGEAPGIFALIGAVVVIVTVSTWCALDAKS